MSEVDKGRIIVIDDDDGIRQVVSTALSNKGYMIATASNGKEAIQKSQTNFYDLALIDIRLPDMDGTNLLPAMTKINPEMRKIILTGYPALQNAIDAVNMGADGYLVKPVDIDVLLRTIEQELEKRREVKEYGQTKVAEYVETRIREMDAKGYKKPETE